MSHDQIVRVERSEWDEQDRLIPVEDNDGKNCEALGRLFSAKIKFCHRVQFSECDYHGVRDGVVTL